MADNPNKNAPLQPYVIKPTDAAPWFSMTRFSPVTDDFYFKDDYLVILSPFDVVWESPVLARSQKTLEEHIQYIQENQFEKVYIVADDIAFLRQCPTITSLKIIPAYSAAKFDYSPIYHMPNLKELNCQTVYGHKDALKADAGTGKLSPARKVTPHRNTPVPAVKTDRKSQAPAHRL